MKQRIISGALCAVVLAVVLFFYDTLVLEAAISALSAIAVYELLSANGFKEHKPFMILGVVAAIIMPYLSRFYLQGIVIAAFLVALVILMLKFHSKISFEKVSFLVVSVLGVSLSFLCILLLI